MTILFNISLLILIFLQLSQSCNISPYTFKHETSRSDQRFSENHAWLVVIANDDPVFRLSYGSLIHARVVLTAAISINGSQASELRVETNCLCESQWYFTSCTSRRVKKILINSSELGNKTILENTWALLILEEPFTLNEKINVIRIALKTDVFDENKCFLTRWMRLYNKISSQMKVVTVVYRVSFVNGSLNITSLDRHQLETDRDFIISRSFHLILIKKNITNQNLLSFEGSPVTCEIEGNPQKRVQVATVTFRLRIPITKKTAPKSLGIIQEGSLINLNGLSDEIFQKYSSQI